MFLYTKYVIYFYNKFNFQQPSLRLLFRNMICRQQHGLNVYLDFFFILLGLLDLKNSNIIEQWFTCFYGRTIRKITCGDIALNAGYPSITVKSASG